MAKKKKVSNIRISPPLPAKDTKSGNYGDFDNGDTFIWDGSLMMKCDTGDQEAVDLLTGHLEVEMCDNGVFTPVDIKITWKEKK